MIQESQKALEKKKEDEIKNNAQLSMQLEIAQKQDQWQLELDHFREQEESLLLKKEEMDACHQKINVLERVERLLPDYDAYQKSIKNLKDIMMRLNQMCDVKRQLDEKMSQLNLKQEEMLQTKNQLETNERVLERINEDLHKVEQFEKAKNLVRQAQNHVNASILEVKNSQNQKEDLEAILNKCQEDLEALPNLEALKLTLTHQSNTLKLAQVQLGNIQTQQQKMTELMASSQQKQSQWENQTQKLRELSDEHLLLEQQYQASLAGILASELKENMPCPVCGSLHHPQLASLNKDGVTKETLETKKQDLQKQSEKVQMCFGDLMQVKQALELENRRYEELLEGVSLERLKESYQNNLADFETKKKNYQEDLKRQDELQSYKKAYTEQYANWQIKDKQIQEHFEKAKENLQKRMETFEFIRGSFHNDFETLDVLIKRKSQLEKEIKQQKTTLNQYQEAFDAVNKATMQNEGELAALSVEKEKGEKQLWENKTQYEHRLNVSNVLENDLLAYKDEVDMLEGYKKDYLEYDKKCSMVHTQLAELTQKLHGERLNSQEIKGKKEIVELELKNIEVQMEKNKWQLQQYHQQYQDIASSLKNFEKAEQKYQEIYELSRLVSGQNPGHITFESYILAAYFEAILERANLRFVTMTNGRYALLRKTEGMSGRAMQGLDLNVMDYESGKPRDIRTLSGGEAFKAALSLALGMADLISENAGGIELDTLFIDEGFGSLDERSLDIALDTLIELKQEHKVVGIISHVAQLKERLSAKIIVSHQKNTSIAKIY